jgi:hypothetical protein
MIRHGTRFPGKNHIISMKNNLPQLQKKIVKNLKKNNPKLFHDLIDNFNKWKLSFNDSDAMYLSDEGMNELIDLAERMQTRFPKLFVDDYSKDLYKVYILYIYIFTKQYYCLKLHIITYIIYIQ